MPAEKPELVVNHPQADDPSVYVPLEERSDTSFLKRIEWCNEHSERSGFNSFSYAISHSAMRRLLNLAWKGLDAHR